ncbi:SDR family oxidoreductase [Amycolatopsis echigonensis]|uniref:SDR family oxidoreductase n=1 Tax=Amycolatopsis echigonensis TaxID=2576905 RepID=A0A8E1VVY6_9PSEU|nr:SDR family oxidoreductase [Amycolatopsis echigonensis]
MPIIREAGVGAIVNTSWEGTRQGDPHVPSTCATVKGGVEAPTTCIAVQYGKRRVLCNSIAPGWP